MKTVLKALLVLFTLTPVAAMSAEPPTLTVYKSETCGCCNKWISHMEENGFAVESHNIRDMQKVKDHYGIAPELQSCHTAVVDGYLIEGHVPASDVKRLLAEKPEVAGLSVPGMPMGSPGMEGPRKDDYATIIFSPKGEAGIYARH